MRFNGTLYRKCNVCLALAVGADLFRSVPGAVGTGAEILPGSLPRHPQRLFDGRIGPDPGAAVAHRHGAGRRFAGDGDDFRL
ncbi:hypothetical protein D3C76_1582610 [compost metagenome]